MRYINSYSIIENVNQAKSFLAKNGINSKTSEDFIKINRMLSGNGYTYWFTKLFFEDKVPFNELENIWNIIKSEPQIISKFKTPVIKLESIEKFWDEYLACKSLNNAKNVYNEFPSTQKKLIDLENDNDILLLSDLYKDSDKVIIIKKISRYHTRKDLINALKIFIYNKSDNTFSKLLSKLKEENVNIKYASDENDIIVVTVDYNQLVKFASDTSWCIVRSEGTFRSYNGGPLSQQFIIFLLDKNDYYSKIGVTSNIKGISASHLKNDSYIDKSNVIDILKERGFDISLLYPTKESALSMDWSYVPTEQLINIGFTKRQIIKKKRLDIYKLNWAMGSAHVHNSDISDKFLLDAGFTIEEIKAKKKEDISKLNWDKIIVKYLLDIGFTKLEIVKRKKIYGEGTTATQDLENFTKEEVEKWKLFDKTKLQFVDLKPFSKEEIVRKKLLNRTPFIHLSQLGELGFTFQEIQKLSHQPRFQNDPAIKFIEGQTRKKIVKLISNYWMNDIESVSRDSIRDMLIRLVSLKEQDIKFSNLYDTFKSSFFDNPITAIKYFSKIYDLTKYMISKLIEKYGKWNEKLYQMTELMKLNLYTDYATELINSYIENENTKLYFDEMNEIKSNLSKYPDLYDKIYNKIRSKLFGGRYLSTYDLKVRDKDGYGSRRIEMNVKLTIKNLKFWDAKDIINIEKMIEIFKRDVSVYGNDMKEVLDFFEYCGYNKSDYFKYNVIKELASGSSGSDELKTLEFCIDQKINVKHCYDLLINYAKSKTTKFKSSEIDVIERLMKKRKGFEDKWNEIVNQDIKNEAIEVTKRTSQFALNRSSNYSTGISPENWYEKYWPIIKKIDFKNLVNIDGHSNYGSTFVSTIVLLAKLDKMDEANEIEYDFIFPQNYTNTILKDLTKIIADKKYYNSSRKWMKLNEDQRKSIFIWLDKKISKYTKDDSNEFNYISREMVIDWYIFNKSKFDKYIEKVKKMRNNVTYYGRGEEIKYRTVRLKELERLFMYLAEEGKFDDLENILSQFNLGKIEKKYSKDIDSWHHLSNARKEGDDISSSSAQKEHREKYKKIMDKYLRDIVKESFIMKWDRFNEG